MRLPLRPVAHWWALLAGIAAGCLLIACTGSTPATTAPTSGSSTTPTVLSILVAGVPPAVGAAAPFSATATLSDGTTVTITSTAAWSSSDASLASVSASGVVTGVAAGDVDITATYQTVVGRRRVTIAPPAPRTFRINGTLRDATSGGVLPRVTVTAEDGASVRHSAVSDDSGAYAIADVSGGRASLSIEADSYEPATQTTTVASDMRIDFVLQRRAPPPPVPGTAGVTWTGSGSDGLGPGLFTWVLTQSGTSVSGSARMRPVSETDGSCASCHKVKDGTISGSISGNTITLRMSFALGGSQPTPTCLVVMDVSASGVTSGSASGSYHGSDSCEPAVGLGTITMTRQ